MYNVQNLANKDLFLLPSGLVDPLVPLLHEGVSEIFGCDKEIALYCLTHWSCLYFIFFKKNIVYILPPNSTQMVV
jgi:hypothetical protein